MTATFTKDERPALNRQVEGASQERYVPASLPEAANDGELSAEDLAAIDLEFAKADALKDSGELRRREEQWYMRQESIALQREWERR